MTEDIESRMYRALRVLTAGDAPDEELSKARELIREYESLVGPKVVIYTDGGVVQNIVVSSNEIEVMLIDYDIEGMPTSEVTQVSENGEVVGAAVSLPWMMVDAAHAGERFLRFGETGGRRC